MSNPEWQKGDAKALATLLNREAKEKIEFKPLGKSVLFEARSNASSLIIPGDSSFTNKRAYVVALGPAVPIESGLRVGDELGIDPSKRYPSMEALVGDAGRGFFLVRDWEDGSIVCVMKREG